MAVGDELLRVVEAYSALGDHRTGTLVDDATVAWFAAELAAIGARVDVLPYEFDRYEARWSVVVDGDEVPSIPLFYEGVGRVRTTTPHRASVDVVGGAGVRGWDDVVSAARSAGAEAAVVATQAGTGRLCAVNRRPALDGSGLLTVCVAGALAERWQDVPVTVELDAQVVPGRSANVFGRVGDGDDDARLLLATPLSGWFRCAGERGTGIAVLLAVARTLAAEGVRVAVLASNGHELEGLGLHRWLAAHEGPAWRGIFHFGASVASGEADGAGPPVERTKRLFVSAWGGDERRSAELADALAPLGVAVRVPSREDAVDPRGWVGESRTWAPLARPLVSIAGGFPLHHAPDDVPALATTPALLEESYAAALAAARLLARP
jgi:hypothetical protein